MKHPNETHGHSKVGQTTPEYTTWCAMKERCHTPTSSGYHKYGAKGIRVCDRWLNSFEAFLEDMGPKPSPDHSIDRWPNQTGNYAPGNCRWATRLEQANNMTTNRVIECDGRSMTLAQWSRESGVDADVISARLDRHGWEVRAAIFTPERSASSGLKGAYWQAARRRWNVRFTRKGVLHDLGRFDNLLDAASALLGNAAKESLERP